MIFPQLWLFGWMGSSSFVRCNHFNPGLYFIMVSYVLLSGSTIPSAISWTRWSAGRFIRLLKAAETSMTGLRRSHSIAAKQLLGCRLTSHKYHKSPPAKKYKKSVARTDDQTNEHASFFFHSFGKWQLIKVQNCYCLQVFFIGMQNVHV